jgi:glycosyltransferase involved in cell wall biosynthesis
MAATLAGVNLGSPGNLRPDCEDSLNYFLELGTLLHAEWCVDTKCPHRSAELQDVNAAHLAFLRSLCRTGETHPVDELLKYVGHSPRTDLLVMMALAPHSDGLAPRLQTALQTRLTESEPADERTAAWLDIATDLDLTLFSLPEIASLIRGNPNRSVSRAALRHLLSFPVADDEEVFLGLPEWLVDDGELLIWMITAHARGHDGETIAAGLDGRPDWAEFMPWGLPAPDSGVTLMQFAMWGDLDRPGEGISGGLGVFVSSLGDALVRQDGVGRVVTVTQTSPSGLADQGAWLREREHGHLVLGLPSLPEGSGAVKEPLAELGWWLRTLLPALGLVPKVAHLRFGSDVTLAIARSLRALDARTVFGIAPDPHRMILDRHHTESGAFDRQGFIEDLHRLFAADTLSEWADSVVALPNARQARETQQFFPRALRRLGSVEAIPEGITEWRAHKDDLSEGQQLLERLFEENGMSGLSKDAVGLPVLLNVGRWNEMKQQDLLVEAWVRSGACDSTLLVLVGGSLEQPTPTERLMRERVVELLTRTPRTSGRFAWLPRLPNRHVRLLERVLVTNLPATASPHAYVCSSVKEEFGISVLEAMDAGLLAIAPRRGGASHYIRPGVTGFLADTSSVWGLTADLSMILGGGPIGRDLASIAETGQRAVQENFTISVSARRLARHYLRLAEK